MNGTSRFGPQPGDYVRVRGIQVYPLPKGLRDGDCVTVKSWDRSYVVEKVGREFTINPVHIVEPLLACTGKLHCPECKGQLTRNGLKWTCEASGCNFTCRVDKPASVVD